MPENYASDQNFVNTLNTDHSFFSAHFGADISFEDTYINSGNFFFRRFGDNKGSGENRFIAKAKVDIPINGEEISTAFKFDYIGGTFDRNYVTADELRQAGYSEGELIRAGFASVDMSTSCDVSVLTKERQEGASALDHKKKGCSVLALAAAGASFVSAFASFLGAAFAAA